MKKLIAILLLFMILFSLNACNWHEPPFKQTVDQIDHIELVHNDFVGYTSKIQKSTLLCTIEGDMIPPFVEKVYELGWDKPYPPMDKASKWEIVICYKNGNKDMMGDGATRYLTDGKLENYGIRNCDLEKIEKLFSEYVDISPYID